MPIKLTQEEVHTYLKERFPHLDCSKFVYAGYEVPGTLICPDHGEFSITLDYLKAKKGGMTLGCKQCGIEKKKQSKVGPEEYRRRLQEIHPHLDLSKFSPISNTDKSIVICKDHGEVLVDFVVASRSPRGCTKCTRLVKGEDGGFLTKLLQKYPKEEVERYDFSESKYLGAGIKISFRCPDHGEVATTPENIFSRQGRRFICGKCGEDTATEEHRITTEEFVRRAIKSDALVEQTYSFEKTKWVNSKEKLEIMCKKHGSFWILPENFLKGTRCARCSCAGPGNASQAELQIKEFIESLGEKVEHAFRIPGSKRHLDIFLPARQIGIEYNGLYWHRDNAPDRISLLEKTELANQQSIRVIHIFEDEWLQKSEIVKRRLRSILNKDARIFARKCTLDTNVTQEECICFLEKFHIQGGVLSPHRLGLRMKGELVAVMTFMKSRFSSMGEYELVRYASSCSVIGGFSRLLKCFEDTINPGSLISYSDARWSIGGVYSKNGFNFSHRSPPGYFWVKGKIRLSRMKFQRQELPKLFPEFFNENPDASKMSEREVCERNGLFRISDCGHDVWVRKRNTL